MYLINPVISNILALVIKMKKALMVQSFFHFDIT